MPLPELVLEELRSSNIIDLKILVDTMTDEYSRLKKEDPVSAEADRCRELIKLIHNIIDEKTDAGK